MQESRSASKENKHLFSTNSNFPLPEEDRSRSLFHNTQYLSTLLEYTNNNFKEETDKKVEAAVQPQTSAKIMPMMFNSESEPRFVNAAQYNRMMIMRIKRAQKVLKNEQRLKELQLEPKIRKYKYESRHLHAKNRERGPDGKFAKKNQ